MRRFSLAVVLLFPALAFSAPQKVGIGVPGKPAEDTCTTCHQSLDDERLSQPATLATNDVHHRQGISCAACHGGDPKAEDPDVAMDPKKGFVGKIPVSQQPELCGSCHSDAEFMRRYAPNIGTDQLAQYRTSKHGEALAKGDVQVATCVSCHGAHGVLPPTDARSPVYPTRIVETCARCHENRALMSQYGVSGAEVADYKSSVHYKALTVKNDLQAPTCNDCHGSHGATPPGVNSVSNVCGTCHLTQREAFDLSPHKEAFAALDQPACEACHTNHKVLPPEDRWIGVGEGQVCGACHAQGDPGADAAKAIRKNLDTTSTIINKVQEWVENLEGRGMLMDEAVVKLEDAHQALVFARNEVHTVDPSRIQAHTQKAEKVLGEASKLAQEAEEELRFRHRGLKIALVIILITLVALGLKIRQVDQRS